MKTRIIGGKSGRLVRLLTKKEREEDPKRQCLMIVRFVPKHDETGQTLANFIAQNGRTHTTTVPDVVRFWNTSVRVGRGGLTSVNRFGQSLHIIPDDYVEGLDRIDGQIDDLKRERDELIEEAFRHGRPLRLSDLES